MTPTAKLVGYAALLVAVLVAGVAAGNAVGPDEPSTEAAASTTVPASGPSGSEGAEEEEIAMPAGLAIARDGYALDLASAARKVDDRLLQFRILGPDGEAVTAFDEQHERDMHLIVASRDLGWFRHVHPTLAPDGTWSVDLPIPSPGPYRVFADFKPTGAAALVLGADLTVAGEHEPSSMPEPATSVTVDGFDVRMEGAPVAGRSTTLVLTVTSDGAPAALQPYLGAGGHLVAIRSGDLAYLHVHPLEGDTEPGEIRFAVETPSAGTYRLFLDFQVDGEVHTAAFTVDVDSDGRPATTPPASDHDADGHGH